MKKRIFASLMLLSFIAAMFAHTQTVQAASSVKAPTAKVELNDDGIPVITWKKVSGATGYRVYRKTSTDAKWVTVQTTSKTKVVDTDCKAKAGSTVKYVVRTYVKANGKNTWSDNSKTVSVKLPANKYTYKIEASDYATYCTYLNNKIVVKEYYGIPGEFVDKNTTLQDLQDSGLNFTFYYYYDDKYEYQLNGANYYWYVYEVQKNGDLKEIGVYDAYYFSPNRTDGSDYLSYEDSLKKFNEFKKDFLAGKLEDVFQD